MLFLFLCCHARMDAQAINIFEWLAVFGNGIYFQPSPALCPTVTLPGTHEKVEVMAARASAGQNLWHDADPRLDGEEFADRHDLKRGKRIIRQGGTHQKSIYALALEYDWATF